MSSTRPRAVLLVLSLLAATPAAGAPPAAPPLEYIPAEAEMAVVIPSLEAFAAQGKALFEVAASFPGAGPKLREGRNFLLGTLGFDLLDVAAVRNAGLDPKGSALVYLVGEGETSGGAFVLPVANRGRFEAAVQRIARDQLGAVARKVDAGSPPVVVWRSRKSSSNQLAYAFVGSLAVVSMDGRAVDDVQAALRVPAGGRAGESAAWRDMTTALGPGLAAIAYFPPGSGILKKTPLVRRGLAVGLGGGAESARVVFAAVLDEAVLERLRENVDPGPMLAKLDPAAVAVFQSRASLTALLPEEALVDIIAHAASEKARRVLGRLFAAVGPGAAFGFAIPPAGSEAAAQVSVPYRLEYALGLSDPEPWRTFLQVASSSEDAQGDRRVSELFQVQDGLLLFVEGPRGAVGDLAARPPHAPEPPTSVSARALSAPLVGGYVDVRRLLAGVRDPERLQGKGPALDLLRAVWESREVLSRFRALSVTSDVVGSAVRIEILAELDPEPQGAVESGNE
jgi:hypothetical protein